jgi:peptidoglycan/xylan/chitin deacetylase (PgdA/CDA1 family)
MSSSRLRRTLNRYLAPLGRIAIRGADPYLAVFAFHEVSDERSVRVGPNTAIGVKAFEQFVGALVNSHEVVSLSEALAMLRSGVLSQRTAVLTFDDGHRSIARHAARVLRSFGLRGTLFLTTSVVSDAAPFFPYLLSHYLKSPQRERFVAIARSVLDVPTLPAEDVSQYLNRKASRSEILKVYRRAQDELISWGGILKETGPLFVSSQDLAANADCFELAMHSHRHIPLARLTAEELDEELHLSRQMLSKFGLPRVNALAPPYGGLGTAYNATQVVQLRTAGVHAIAGCYGGLNGVDQPVSLLRRIPVSDSRLFGNIHTFIENVVNTRPRFSSYIAERWAIRKLRSEKLHQHA